MLNSARIVAFLQVTDRQRAKQFFVDVLGLRCVSEDPFALVVESNGTRVRIGEAREFVPARGTVLGWEVPDIEESVSDLRAKGVELQHYGFTGQDDRGIWTTPSGDKVAWFKDPAGNVLSVSQRVSASSDVRRRPRGRRLRESRRRPAVVLPDGEALRIRPIAKRREWRGRGSFQSS